MGIHFRASGYLRHAIFSGRTIKDGEAAAIWNNKGVHRQVIGPCRTWLFNSTIDFLDRFKAEPHQYLRVAHRDGRIEHIQGPRILYKNPTYHDNISVHDGIMLNSNSECIVVYKTCVLTNNIKTHLIPETSCKVSTNELMNDDDLKVPSSLLTPTGTVQVQEINNKDGNRNIVYGPIMFFPKPHEKVHNFTWSTFNNKEKDPSFHIVNTGTLLGSIQVSIPTSDGFSLDVELVFDYHIKSIDKVIASNDPISKMHYGIMADCQNLGLSISSDDMLNDAGATQVEGVIKLMTTLDTYSNLQNISENSGVSIDCVRVTHLSFCEKLLGKIDKERREAEQRQCEINQKLQIRKMNEFELEDRRKSINEEAELRQRETDINHNLNQVALDRRLELEKQEAQSKRELTKIEDDGVLYFLNELNKLDVDMTKFMISSGGMGLASPIMKRLGLPKELLEKDEEGLSGKDEEATQGSFWKGRERRG